MWIAVWRSWLVPDSIWRRTSSDSFTPPAHDWTSVVMSCRNPFTSAARSARVGRCASPTRTAPASTTAPAANSHRGVLWAGHPPCRSGTAGGSFPVGATGACIGSASLSPLADEGGSRGQFRLADRPVDALHDEVARIEEERCGQPRQVVRDDGAARGGFGGDRIGDTGSADERERRRRLVVHVDADDRQVRVPGAEEPGEQGRLLPAGYAPGGEEVHDDGPAGHRAEGDPLARMAQHGEAEVFRARGRGVLRADAAGAGEAQDHDDDDPHHDGSEGSQPGTPEAAKPVRQALDGAGSGRVRGAHRVLPRHWSSSTASPSPGWPGGDGALAGTVPSAPGAAGRVSARSAPGAVTGSTSSNSLPPPGVLCTSASPPWARATARTRGRPSPVRRPSPSSDADRNRSKMWSSSAAGIPVPVSEMIMRTVEPSSADSTDSWIASPSRVCRTA